MSKPKLDLDFSDVTTPPANQVAAPAPAPKQEAKKVELKEAKPSGYIIAIDDREPGAYRFKDLDDLTGEEFLTFATRVFPAIDVDSNPRDFDTKMARKRAFDQILRFHQSSLFHSPKEGKGHAN